MEVNATFSEKLQDALDIASEQGDEVSPRGASRITGRYSVTMTSNALRCPCNGLGEFQSRA